MPLDWLFERLESGADKPALIWRDQLFSYGQLLGRSRRWREELKRAAVQPGEVVVIEGDYSPEAIALLLALIHARAIVVPLTLAAASQRDGYLSIAGADRIISQNTGWSIETRRGGEKHPLIEKLKKRNAPGLVLFSSGSTGESKAALHDFTKLLGKFREPRPAWRGIPFLLFDHIGGINTLFHLLSNGGTVVIAEDRSPDGICALMERHRVELLPTSPTFLNLLLLTEAHRRHDLSSLRLITYGTEPMPESLLARLTANFPQLKFQQTYGLSELGILRTQTKTPDSLLMRIGGTGVETRVVDGLLWIRSDSAMLGYLNAPQPFDSGGWFNTGDEVVVEGDYYRVLGRRSELINVGGEKVHPSEVEDAILDLPNIADVLVTGESNPLTGQMVVARVWVRESEDPIQLRQRVRAWCRERLAPYKVPAKVELSPEPLFGARFKKQRSGEKRKR